jgi:hypothetical protein
MAGTTEEVRERTERVEERPGLTMIKRVTRKEDGRWLIYYDFERGEAASQGEAAK